MCDCAQIGNLFGAIPCGIRVRENPIKSMTTTYTDGILILIQCPFPECANRPQQTAQFSRAELKRDLDADQDIRVFGVMCGHHWSFTYSQKKDLREAIEAGKL